MNEGNFFVVLVFSAFNLLLHNGQRNHRQTDGFFGLRVGQTFVRLTSHLNWRLVDGKRICDHRAEVRLRRRAFGACCRLCHL